MIYRKNKISGQKAYSCGGLGILLTRPFTSNSNCANNGVFWFPSHLKKLHSWIFSLTNRAELDQAKLMESWVKLRFLEEIN